MDPYTDEVFEVSNTQGIPEGTPIIQFKSENSGSASNSEKKGPEPKTRTKEDTARIKLRQEQVNTLNRRSDTDVVSSEEILISIQSRKGEATEKSLNSIIDTSVQIDEDISGGYEFE